MNNLLLFDNNSETDSSTYNANIPQTPSSNQSSPNKPIEFYISQVSADVVSTAYERHTSGLMSTYLYHILTKVKLNIKLLMPFKYILFYCISIIFRRKSNYLLC